MTIEEFAKESNLRIKTIKKNILRIKGITITNGEVIIPEGSRYPYNLGNSKLDTRERKLRALLEATNHYRYIDNEMLRISSDSFSTIINELIQAGLLIENGCSNPYGANRFDVSMAYSDYSRKELMKVLNSIAELSGAFVGAYVSSQV